MTNHEYLKNLIELGLNTYEAKVYLSMLGKNSITASDASKMSGVPRQRIYDILTIDFRKADDSVLPTKLIEILNKYKFYSLSNRF